LIGHSRIYLQFQGRGGTKLGHFAIVLRAREQAQKVPVKILGPLLLCFLPGLFIIILGPAIVTVADVFLRG